MAEKKIDWMDLAHCIDKERERIQDSLPSGIACSLSVHAYGFSAAAFSISLEHVESKCHGYGEGRTPTKALEDAKVRLQKKYEEWQRRPRLAGVKALGPAQTTETQSQETTA